MNFIRPNILRTVLVTSIITSTVSGKDNSPKIVPTSYDVHLHSINLESDMSYQGIVTIELDVLKKVSEIHLNIRDLEVILVQVKFMNMKLAVNSYKVDKNHERLVIEMDALYPGKSTVIVHFKGTINNKSVGFFKTQCMGKTNSWISGVRMEPINGRSVFPCLDVSETKTTVSVTLTLGKQYKVISKQTNPTLSGDIQDVEMNFGEINVGQVSWVIYPAEGFLKYESVEGPHGHKVLSCRSNWEWLNITMISNAMMEYIDSDVRDTKWIIMPDLPVPVSSLDGMVFIRESLVEYSNYTSMNDYFENTLNIAEGYAEQWLGQTIRAKSWSDLWLVKGLANFLKFKLTDMIASGMNVTMDSYIVSKLMPRVLEREVIPHSLSKDDADSKNDVWAMYDQDLFDRAGLIMRMIEDRVEENAFRAAIKNFIFITKQSGMASSKIFFDSLSNASLNFPENKSAGDTMQSWISSGGYPIVSASREGNWITITQKSAIKSHKENKGHWWIPFTVTSKNLRTKRKFWLRPTGTQKISLSPSDDWYMINEDGKGFYRVNYDAKNWKKLSEAISNGELSEIAKARLLDDALGLAEDGHLPYSIGLGLSRHLSDENDESVSWLASVRHLLNVRLLLEPSRKSYWDEYVALLVQNFTLKHTEKTAESKETIDQSEISEELLKAFYRMYQTHKLCQQNRFCGDTINYFLEEARKNSYTSKYGGDMLDGVLCLAIENNNNSTIWETWLDTYMTFESPSLESKIINGLTCTKNNSLQHRLLDMFLADSSNLKRQDFVTYIQNLDTETTSNDLITLLTNHLDKIMLYFSGDQTMLSDAIITLSEGIYEPPTISQAKAFLSAWSETDNLSNDRNREQFHRAIRRMEQNGERRKRSSNDIIKWLKNTDTDMDFDIPSGSPTSFIYNIYLLIALIVSLCSYY